MKMCNTRAPQYYDNPYWCRLQLGGRSETSVHLSFSIFRWLYQGPQRVNPAASDAVREECDHGEISTHVASQVAWDQSALAAGAEEPHDEGSYQKHVWTRTFVVMSQ